jgi:O-antigen/teichoic acid export membrane protein
MVIKIMMPLILVPIFLKTWGSESYSEWLVLFSYVAFLGLVDLGLGNYSTTHVHLRKSKGLSYKKTLKFITSIYINLVLAASIFFLILVYMTNQVGSDLPIPLLILLGFTNILMIVNGYINSIYRIYNEQHYAVYVSIAYNFFNYVGIYFLLQLESNQILIASWMLLVVVCSILIIGTLVKNKYNLSFNYLYSIRVYRTYISKSIFYVLYKLTAILRVHFPVIILSIVNPVNIIIYTLHRTVVNVQNQFLNLVHSTLLQDLTRNSVTISSVVYVVFLFIGVVSISISFITYLLYPYIFEVWIGEGFERFLDQDFLLLFLVYGFINTLWYSNTIFLVAKNDHETLSKKILSYVMLANILSFPAYYYFGLYGYMLALIILEVILGQFWIFRFMLKKLNTGVTIFTKSYLIFLAYFLFLFLINAFKFQVMLEVLFVLFTLLVFTLILYYSYRKKLLALFKH